MATRLLLLFLLVFAPMQLYSATAADPFIRGDADLDGDVDQADMLYWSSWYNGYVPYPTNPDSADANDDGYFDMSDSIYLSYYLYQSGDEPPPPFACAGYDPTPDSLNSSYDWQVTPGNIFNTGMSYIYSGGNGGWDQASSWTTGDDKNGWYGWDSGAQCGMISPDPKQASVTLKWDYSLSSPNRIQFSKNMAQSLDTNFKFELSAQPGSTSRMHVESWATDTCGCTDSVCDLVENYFMIMSGWNAQAGSGTNWWLRVRNDWTGAYYNVPAFSTGGQTGMFANPRGIYLNQDLYSTTCDMIWVHKYWQDDDWCDCGDISDPNNGAATLFEFCGPDGSCGGMMCGSGSFPLAPLTYPCWAQLHWNAQNGVCKTNTWAYSDNNEGEEELNSPTWTYDEIAAVMGANWYGTRTMSVYGVWCGPWVVKWKGADAQEGDIQITKYIEIWFQIEFKLQLDCGDAYGPSC